MKLIFILLILILLGSCFLYENNQKKLDDFVDETSKADLLQKGDKLEKDSIILLKEKLAKGTPEEKEEVIDNFMSNHIIELVPDIINAVLDDTILPRHDDTGWGNVYHQAATALCQFAYKIDGITQKDRGYKEFSFYNDAGTASEERRREVYKNWSQWWEENKKSINKLDDK